ncbi:DUF924 family protein [Piscinibacter koreensis]|uniref:DUF924 domain-containing protein n=1 Tax=Piscinibacter koreensis TaxID=2742824 RepID=A0A7Y6TXK9_9BURK|nr:DUF924 family protein [Schlegelella koreensis]NUZ07175.1 DUF924 domain-containing protein [Schlegelella koreensis]
MNDFQDTPATSGSTTTVAASLDPRAREVLDFWFGPAEAGITDVQRQTWFSKDEAFDAAIATRFGTLIEQALRGELESWGADPHGALAEILLLDQFTRNAFRGTPRAFAGDPRALGAASALVGSRGDLTLEVEWRAFAYMPFEHAESLAMQDEAVRLFTRLVQDAGRERFASMLDYAERHRAVIERFGRFPHRNPILGRQSTPEEAVYLSEPGAGF